jgi:hypothetical protein
MGYLVFMNTIKGIAMMATDIHRDVAIEKALSRISKK